nr:TetR family transcriptional regulator [Rhodococcus sp. (in: high G+C Gram-positive bacteria)]
MTDLPGTRAKPGRRPGRSGARDKILAMARTRFANTGFDATSVRSIASDAGVDAALVHHYFGTKRELFLAAVALPTDPETVLRPVLAASTDTLGETLLRAIMSVWDSDSGDAVVAAFRSMLAGGGERLIEGFIMQVVLEGVAPRIDHPAGSAPVRINLVASQLSGLLLTRYILKLEPIASMPFEDVIASIGPTLQRYLVDDLP